MSNLLNKIASQTTSLHRKQQSETKKLISKWEKFGLLEGISNAQERQNMAILLENEARHLLKEFSKTGGAGSEEWSSIALPLVRRIFSEISAKNFVSVQPMTLPSGLVFYIDFKYGTAKTGFSTTPGVSNEGDSVYGITNQSGSPTGGLYGAGRFGYSLNSYTATKAFVTGSVSAADVNFNSELTAISGSLKSVTVDLTGLSHDKYGIKAFDVVGSGVGSYYPEFTKAVDENGIDSNSKVTFVVLPSGSFGANVDIKYHKQTTAGDRGDFEAQGDPSWGDGDSTDLTNINQVGANDLDIPELDIDIRQEGINANTRKLKAKWTPELAQDLDAYHSVDAESEVTSVMSEYVSMEIDLELLSMLYSSAVTTEVWSAQIGKVYNGSAFVTQDSQQGRSLAYNQEGWFRTLGTKMQSTSNKIHKKIIRGGANFAVVSPDIATILDSIPGYSTDLVGGGVGTDTYAMGVVKSGNFNKRFDIYTNPYWTSNVVVMGYRGNKFLETGSAYAPYVPLIMTPTIYDTENFTPRKGLSTRYAKKMLRPEYYGRIHVADLNLV